MLNRSGHHLFTRFTRSSQSVVLQRPPQIDHLDASAELGIRRANNGPLLNRPVQSIYGWNQLSPMRFEDAGQSSHQPKVPRQPTENKEASRVDAHIDGYSRWLLFMITGECTCP